METESYDVQKISEVDKIESTHAELQRSHEYSAVDESGEYVYSTTRLEALGRGWMKESNNPLRSERSRGVAALITERLVFEIAYRNNCLEQLEATYAKN